MSISYLSSQSRISHIFRSILIVMPEVLERERELANWKWYAYRFLSPLAATRHFADLYRKGLKAYVRANQDIDAAERVIGLKPDIFSKPSRELTALWKARQQADEFGIPYELIVNFGFHFGGRRKRKYPPRPAQLYAGENSHVAWPAEFEKYLEVHGELFLDAAYSMPQYQLENDRSLSAQNDLRKDILEVIETAMSGQDVKLIKHCLNHRNLKIEDAMAKVPEAQRENTRSLLRWHEEQNLLTPVPAETLPDSAYWPSCFGIPFARCANAMQCALCPAHEECSAAITLVSERMINHHGNLSPLREARKRMENAGNRRRQQKHRDKVKALSAGALQ